METTVRDLLEQFQLLPPEMRLKLVVETLAGEMIEADNYQLERNADVMELRFTGALVKEVAKD